MLYKVVFLVVVFHCGCNFHSACALSEVASICSDEDLALRIQSARKSIELVDNFDPNVKSNLSFTLLQSKAKQAVIEAVGDECVSCGIRAADSIDIPLLNDADDDPW